MKRIVLALALGATTMGTAHAQDAAPSFTGPRVGISAGWNQGTDKQVLPGPGETGSKKSGIAVRGVVGYDAPIGNFVTLGGELGVGIGGRDIVTRNATQQYRTDPGITFDASARLGVKPTNNVLLFGRAGWAMQRVKTTLTNGAVSVTDKDTEHGFLFGGGAELAVTQNVALRVDYDRTNFSDHYKRNRVMGGVSVRF